MLNKEYYYNASVEDVFGLEEIDESMHIRDFDRWLNSEHAILNDSERRYLRCLVLPFYDNVIDIAKMDSTNDRCFIRIDTKNEKLNSFESTFLPYFSKYEMYLGMETDKFYTLRELGIFK